MGPNAAGRTSDFRVVVIARRRHGSAESIEGLSGNQDGAMRLAKQAAERKTARAVWVERFSEGRWRHVADVKGD